MAQSEEAQEMVTETPKKRRHILRYIIAGIVVVALIGGLVVEKKKKAQAAGIAGVRTAEIKRGALVQKVSSTGVVAAETGADIKVGSQITGTIQHLYADIDTKVQAGQVIAELAAPDLTANLNAAKQTEAQNGTKYQQQLEGVGMLHTQYATAFEEESQSVQNSEAKREQAQATVASSQSALRNAQSGLVGAQALQKSAESKLRSAQANEKYQPLQTTADIRRATAALSTAQSNLTQTQKSANLTIANSQSALDTAQSNAALASSNLTRQEALLEKGYISPLDVDALRTQRDVTAQQVKTAQDSLRLTREKVTADLQSATDAVETAKAALAAAQSETLQNTMRSEDVLGAETAVEDAAANVAQAQTQVESAKSNIISAQAGLRSAEGDVRNARSAQQAALANLTQDKLKQRDVQAAYQQVLQSKAQVAYQQAQSDKSFIRTPISGTVIALTQQEGETVAAGLSAPTLIEVCALDKLEVNAYVDETDIGKIQVGQEASVTVDAFAKTPFKGKVTKISSAATMQQNVVTYQVTVKLDSYPVGELKPQMTATTQITLMEKVNVTLAPNEAIKQGRGETQAVVMKNGLPEIRTVETGLTDGSYTEILSGLAEGDTVVLAGFDKLGIQGFGSAAGVPGFLTKGPLGTGGGGAKGGGK